MGKGRRRAGRSVESGHGQGVTGAKGLGAPWPARTGEKEKKCEKRGEKKNKQEKTEWCKTGESPEGAPNHKKKGRGKAPVGGPWGGSEAQIPTPLKGPHPKTQKGRLKTKEKVGGENAGKGVKRVRPSN